MVFQLQLQKYSSFSEIATSENVTTRESVLNFRQTLATVLNWKQKPVEVDTRE